MDRSEADLQHGDVFVRLTVGAVFQCRFDAGFDFTNATGAHQCALFDDRHAVAQLFQLGQDVA